MRAPSTYNGRWDVEVSDGVSVIGNLRAEPTTEVVARPASTDDIQPYQVGNWAIVHNGTIANDKELKRAYSLGSGPTPIDSWVIAALLDAGPNANRGATPSNLHQKLVGSYAILAQDDKRQGKVYYSCNYRPLYRVWTAPYNGQALSSVPLSGKDELIPPYSHGLLDMNGELVSVSNRKREDVERTLVVHSGGLDSTVAAKMLQDQGHEVTLLHFTYGARAGSKEAEAVQAIAHEMGVPYTFLDASFIKHEIGGSRLTETGNTETAGGIEGAEYAHEWVPARNLIMLSMAVGYAEAHGFNGIALGANLEEAGAYPDNEPEFLERAKAILPFSVGDGVNLSIHTPVGNLMKHEIVRKGLEHNAPMHLSWSCYNAGERHCGECGPCYMRRVAFEINNETDPVQRRSNQ